MSTSSQQPQFRPQLDSSVHPSVHLAIRNIMDMIYDLQGGVFALQSQLLGGAIATATVNSNGQLSAITLQNGGYYLTAPAVTFTGSSFSVQPKAHAVLTNNRVTSVVIDNPGSGGSGIPTVVFTI